MQAAFPDGISEEHLSQPPRRTVHATWIGLLVLGAILVASLFGVFGGHRNAKLSQTANGVTLSVSTPRTLRNGEFFEIRIDLAAQQPIAEPAIAISAGSVRDLTLNTLWPDPASQTFEQDAFLLEYNPLAPTIRSRSRSTASPTPPCSAAQKAGWRCGTGTRSSPPCRSTSGRFPDGHRHPLHRDVRGDLPAAAAARQAGDRRDDAV